MSTPRSAVVVVAAAAWPSALVQPLGLKLPLLAERGYHMQYADAGIQLNDVVTELEQAFAVTPMDSGLRVGGTEEICLADNPPSWAREDALQDHAGKMFPGARLQNGTRWAGPRPGAPDSLPAIGALPDHPDMYIAAGHGHLSLSGAPQTAHIIAALLCGEIPDIDLAPFAPDHFQREA